MLRPPRPTAIADTAWFPVMQNPLRQRTSARHGGNCPPLGRCCAPLLGFFSHSQFHRQRVICITLPPFPSCSNNPLMASCGALLFPIAQSCARWQCGLTGSQASSKWWRGQNSGCWAPEMSHPLPVPETCQVLLPPQLFLFLLSLQLLRKRQKQHRVLWHLEDPPSVALQKLAQEVVPFAGASRRRPTAGSPNIQLLGSRHSVLLLQIRGLNQTSGRKQHKHSLDATPRMPLVVSANSFVLATPLGRADGGGGGGELGASEVVVGRIRAMVENGTCTV